jgi:hypothetical protein
MNLTFNAKKDFSVEEVSDVIRSALDLDKRIAKIKKDKYFNICKEFEGKYNMESGFFMEKFDSGQLDDRDDYFDWYAAKKGLNIWSKKLEILSGINL